jgi:hypothetical protein
VKKLCLADGRNLHIDAGEARVQVIRQMRNDVSDIGHALSSD